MSRTKKLYRNIFVLIVFFFVILFLLGFHLTPLSAHESSERSVNYGPSEVVHIEDYEKGKYYLGKYDKWVSCDAVYRKMFFLWHADSMPISFENDKTKAIGYTWASSGQFFRAYGIVNDNTVTKVEITISTGDILTQTDFYEDLFLLTYKSKKETNVCLKSIRGYDAVNKIVFEQGY